jgi:hypothetical protein
LRKRILKVYDKTEEFQQNLKKRAVLRNCAVFWADACCWSWVKADAQWQWLRKNHKLEKNIPLGS